jgi:hypothetical protein
MCRIGLSLLFLVVANLLQCLSERARAATGDFEQQLPSIQPKSEHGRAARDRTTIHLSDQRYFP